MNRRDRQLYGLFGVTILALVRRGIALEQWFTARRERKTQ